MNREEYISSLRQVADFFEQHPEITELPHPFMVRTIWLEDPKPILALIVKAAGKARKIYTEKEFQIEMQFGCIMVRYDAAREKVCERIKVGEKVIPAYTLPARAEEVLIPEKIEEIFEWKCPESLLGGAL